MKPTTSVLHPTVFLYQKPTTVVLRMKPATVVILLIPTTPSEVHHCRSTCEAHHCSSPFHAHHHCSESPSFPSTFVVRLKLTAHHCRSLPKPTILVLRLKPNTAYLPTIQEFPSLYLKIGCYLGIPEILYNSRDLHGHAVLVSFPDPSRFN